MSVVKNIVEKITAERIRLEQWSKLLGDEDPATFTKIESEKVAGLLADIDAKLEALEWVNRVIVSEGRE